MNLVAIENELVSFFRKGNGSVRKEDHKEDYDKKAVLVIAARHWGHWEIPEGEDDDGDYDWEVLDHSSNSTLRGFIMTMESKYKAYKFRSDVSEKNWISITVSEK